jgi:hypothetical protein
MRWLRWSLIGLALLGLAGCLTVGILGSAVVHDETGEVVAAVITNDRQEQALLRLPGGHFFTVPAMEGVIEVRCRNGAKRQHGYVTGYMHTSVRVTGAVPCARVEDG